MTAITPQEIMRSCNPSPRADPFQNQVGRHLEYKVAEEEDAGAESLLVHGERRKPDIDAIQKGDDVA